MKKILISMLLSVTMLCSLTVSAMAVNNEVQKCTYELYKLELLKGSGTDENGNPIYDLNREMNRMEAVTMVVRLLGKEAEALSGTWTTPFTDVEDWAKPYVGYAYTNGLTKGIGDTTFGSQTAVTATQYLTLILRSLGYQSEVDFLWDSAWELTDKIGLTDSNYDANTSEFLRADVFVISFHALYQCLKGSETQLADSLRVPADNNSYTLQGGASLSIANKTFNGDVAITGVGNISFSNCHFKGDIYNNGGMASIVELAALSDVDGICYINNNLKEATIDDPLPKFIATDSPLTVICGENNMGAVLCLNREVTFNGEIYRINETGIASSNITQFLDFDPATGETVLYNYSGQAISYLTIAQWWENGMLIKLAACK